MSTYPDHVNNIKALEDMGFDMSDEYEDGEVSLDSWTYDNLVYLMQKMIIEMGKQDFKISKEVQDKSMNRTELVQKYLHAYGNAIRNDWSALDGRTIRSDLEYIASFLNDGVPTPTFNEWLEITGIEDREDGNFYWID